MWLPDTNVWITYVNRRASRIKEEMRARPVRDIWLCDVVKAELYFGAFKSQRREENLAVVGALCAGFQSLPFDGAAAREFGRIRADLERAGMPIGPYDLQIAAIALVHNLTLVTHNVSEFSRIPSIQIEDWESDR